MLVIPGLLQSLLAGHSVYIDSEDADVGTHIVTVFRCQEVCGIVWFVLELLAFCELSGLHGAKNPNGRFWIHCVPSVRAHWMRRACSIIIQTQQKSKSLLFDALARVHLLVLAANAKKPLSNYRVETSIRQLAESVTPGIS